MQLQRGNIDVRHQIRIIIAVIGLILGGSLRPAAADPIKIGAPVVITYSYSNLLDGTFLLMEPPMLRAATEEALGLWAAYAPLHFVELPDSGPSPSDQSYPPAGSPQIRIGHHPSAVAAHAFFPDAADGLGGDVHFDSGGAWNLQGGPWNFLEAVAHELGHSLGLEHELDRPAVMNPFYPQQRFAGLGTGFLYPADVEQLRSFYGAGRGSVTALEPTPEPGSLLLAATGIAILAYRRRRSAARSE